MPELGPGPGKTVQEVARGGHHPHQDLGQVSPAAPALLSPVTHLSAPIMPRYLLSSWPLGNHGPSPLLHKLAYWSH